MNPLMYRALNTAEHKGAQYSDIRIVNNLTETISVKDGVPETVSQSETMGFGVRALVDGAWGFASSDRLSEDEIDRVTGLAIETALASALVAGERTDLGEAVTSQGSYQTPVKLDPFKISLADKLGLLLAADAEMRRVDGVRVRRGNLNFVREQKWFANSEGALTEQTLVESGGGIQATAVAGGEVQVRSYPNAFARQQVTGGWEAVLTWDLPGNAYRIASEAVALLTADACPAGIDHYPRPGRRSVGSANPRILRSPD